MGTVTALNHGGYGPKPWRGPCAPEALCGQTLTCAGPPGARSGGQLGPEELLQDRLRCGQAEEAVGLLGAMDWSTMGAECYRALAAIADHLLRQELDQDREGGAASARFEFSLFLVINCHLIFHLF